MNIFNEARNASPDNFNLTMETSLLNLNEANKILVRKLEKIN